MGIYCLVNGVPIYYISKKSVEIGESLSLPRFLYLLKNLYLLYSVPLSLGKRALVLEPKNKLILSKKTFLYGEQFLVKMSKLGSIQVVKTYQYLFDVSRVLGIKYISIKRCRKVYPSRPLTIIYISEKLLQKFMFLVTFLDSLKRFGDLVLPNGVPTSLQQSGKDQEQE